MKVTRIVIALLISLSLQSAQSGWVRTNGPSSGRIRCFTVNGAYLFAGTWGAGVFRSSDNGTKWTQVNSGLTNTAMSALVSVGPTLVAGTEAGGVFRSSDAGTNWTPANDDMPMMDAVNGFAVISDSDRVHLFAATGGGYVLRSTTSGASWDTVRTATHSVRALCVVGKDLYMGGYFGVFRSTDRGVQWTEVDSGMVNKYVSEFATDGTNLYASTFGAGVFRTTNGGTLWAQAGLAYRNLWALTFCRGTLFAGDWGSGVFRSTNGGTSWDQPALTDKYIASLGVKDSLVFAGVDGEGVYRTTNNGAVWAQSGLAAGLALTLTGGGSDLWSGGYGGVSVSADSGATWVQKGLKDRCISAIAVDGTSIFAAATVGGVYLSTDNGSNWSTSNTGLTNLSMRALAVVPNGTGGKNLYAATRGSGVFLSSDSGKNWTQVVTGLTNKWVFALAVNGNNLFAGTYGGGVFLSTNAGGNWTQTALTSAYVISLATKGTIVVAGTRDDGLYVSADSGKSWTQRGPANASVRTLAVGGTKVFAGTESGIWLSTNNGTNWSTVNAGLADSNIYSLGVNGTNLFAGPASCGVWKSPLSELIVSVRHAEEDAPRAFSLAQNYPNPFNPSTKIGYTIAGTRHEALGTMWVKLAVYDMLGREVAVLVNEKKEAGNYEVKFDGTGLSSGVYYYRIEVRPLDSAVGGDSRSGAGDFIQAKKLVLVK